MKSSFTDHSLKGKEQLATFYVGNEFLGIVVENVEEVAGPMPLSKVPRAPSFVKGLVNLRGQIATAISLRQILTDEIDISENSMSIICKIEGSLISLIVDSIGDVLMLDKSAFESVPDTIPSRFNKFITGVYKMDGKLLSVVDIKALYEELLQIHE